MLYVIMGVDAENSLQIRPTVRPSHLARVQQLKDEGRLVIAGPHPAIDSPDPGPAGFSGSLIIAEFPDLQAATNWAEADPYHVAGVFRSITVKPFIQVLP